MRRVGLIGARGHVGAELLALLAAHPDVTLVRATSRERAGEAVPGHALTFAAPDPRALAADALDGVLLAVPNGETAPWVEAIAPATVIVDLSADHRFDDRWAYGQPERRRKWLRGATRIASPGCYATAMQLALDPIAGELAAAPSVFGVSGWSGAGTTPSPRNDPDRLRDNLLPYAPIDHLHEREVTRALGAPVRFHPHVAPFFRGITLTISALLRGETTAAALLARYRERYAGEPLVRVTTEAPEVAAIAGRHDVAIGGFAARGREVVLHATIDNLLGGAATQALRNLNLAFGLAENLGVPA